MILTSCFQVSHFSIYNNPGADRICIHTYIHIYIYMKISNNPQKGGNIFEHSIFYLLQDDSTLHMLLSML